VSLFIQPPPIETGNSIGIVAPGRKIDALSIAATKQIVEDLGYNVVLGRNLYTQNHTYLSAADEERLSDLQFMLDSPDINAILCARGGYGTTRIIDRLDFTVFRKNPKWVCGFSDITALHLKLQQLGVQSIHSTMPIMFGKPESKSSIDSLFQALKGTPQTIEAKGSEFNKTGNSAAVLVGGNLSLLADSLGTSTEVDTANKILVIEEIDEYLYKIDRLLVQLKRAGKLNNLAGLVVGHITDCKESELPFGETYQQIILNHVSAFNYPVGFNFPIGHDNPNLAFVEGKEYVFTVTRDRSSLL
jgi:muramoyltetrapeptide carboxypeptidase